jgi:antitoxin MazE
MKASIIKIGNSKGIRIPKPVLDQCGFKNTVTLEVKEKKLLVYSDRKARDGWEDEFRKRESGTGQKAEQLNDYFENEWDSKEWEW